ncbi:MAG TPA: SAM domain-containing protein [Beijerinckiaceae bacterium]|nr:SAM domain-containing protein [Beijerinckiaceae bacterium]
MDIAAWLQKLGLERFEPAFRENRIDSEILPRLTAEDLKDLGVTLVGDRRRLLDAVAALRAGTSKISERSAEPIAGPPAASDHSCSEDGSDGRASIEERALSGDWRAAPLDRDILRSCRINGDRGAPRR